jgi:hypothetical protein
MDKGKQKESPGKPGRHTAKKWGENYENFLLSAIFEPFF